MTSTSRRLVLMTLGLTVLLAGGCRQDMRNQAKHKPLSKSEYYVDGASARAFPEGTVARGWLREDTHLHTGIGEDGAYVETFPFPIDAAALIRGQQRYDIFCSPCHDQAGNGYGMIVRRGFKQPPSFHDERLRNEAPGYFFDVITNGFGDMYGYASQIPVADRWAITGYIRALQRSRSVPVSALSAQQREYVATGHRIDAAEAAGESGGHH